MPQPSDIEAAVAEQYERFIEFGQLLTKQMRRYLVRYLHHKVEPGRYELPELDDQYFRYFQRALDDIFEGTGLLELLGENRRITTQVITDTLRWLRKTYDKVRRKNPYQDEQDRLEGWSVTPLHVLERRWPHLVNYLRQEYQPEQLDVSFYQARFEELLQERKLEALDADDRRRLELLYTDLLAQWDALLYARILDYQLRHLEEEHQTYCSLLQAKVDEYKRLQQLISPFSDYLGWDLSRKLWQDTSFDVVEQYHELLESEDAIRELAELLGKLREAEIELQEETLEKTIIRQEWVPDPMARTEIVGIRESDDLNRLLSSEVGLLSDPGTEDLFLKRYADKHLLTFRYEDQKLVTSEEQVTEVYNKVRQKEKGPFIVCVDTSESMMGRPEQVAKVCTLAILKMALQENRRAYLINFSRGIETLDLYDISGSIDALAKFLRMSFYGGTDISLALHEAFRQIRTEQYRDADVLVISDFILYRLDPRILDEVSYFQHHHSTQFHSLVLGDQANRQITRAFDTNWQYDPRQKGVIRELNAQLQDISTR